MLQIDSIEIEGFRGILKGKLDRLAQVNVLVGRNNSGKSTVCEALLRAALPGAGHRDPRQEALLERWAGARGERTDESVRAMATFRLTIAGVESILSFAHGSLRSGGFTAPIDPFARACDAFKPNEGLDLKVEAGTWAAVLRPRGDKRLAASLTAIYGQQLDGVQVLPDQNLYLLHPERGEPLGFQGDGPRTALRCLMRLATQRKSFFVIEEPECFQHPGALKRYALALCEQAAEQEVQLFVTTHSMECLDAFADATETSEASFAVHHLSLADGTLDVRWIERDTFRGLSQGHTDVRELDLYA